MCIRDSNWIVVGTMTGVQSRKVHTEPEWAWSLTDQTHALGIPVFRKEDLVPIIAVSYTHLEELLYDNAFNLENYILEQFGKALANAEEDAFINGTGTCLLYTSRCV